MASLDQVVNLLNGLSKRLDSIESKIGSGGGAGGAGGAATGESGAAFVSAFDDLVNEHITKYIDLSNKIGDHVAEHAALVKEAIDAQRAFLNIAAQAKKPDVPTLQALLKPSVEKIQAVAAFRDANRTSKFWNQLSTMSEGIAALQWVGVSPTPGPFVNEARSSSEFWSNKVLREFKGKDENQTGWVAAYNGFLKELFKYIKQYHTTEVTWNPKGEDASKFIGAAGAAAPKAAAAAAPQKVTVPKKNASGGAGGLFAELNKGGAVTSGLKKVTKDMKTKNQKGRSAVVPAKANAGAKRVGTPNPVKRGEPKFELQGHKWVVENQVENRELVISDTATKQTVYVYNCDNCTIQVKGKVNAITLDKCRKTAIVFENAISSCEVVNCKSVQVQCLGKVPSFAVDRTEGAQIFISKEGFDAEFITSSSSEMNIVLPPPTENDDIIELPVPEQYKTVIVDSQLKTEHVQHTG